MKKAFLIVLALAMVFGLVACSKNSSSAPAATTAPATAPAAQAAPAPAPAPVVEQKKELTIEEKLMADTWCFSYTAEGYGDFAFYFMFHDDDPILGKVFFAGLNNNRANFAGTYKLMERPYEYGIYLSRQDAVDKTGMVSGTVPYTVVMFDWEGNPLGTLGFDGEKLYNAQDKNTAKVYATGSTPYAYEKNTGKYDSTIAGLVPVVVYEFVADDDVTSTIQINHNHTYTDLVLAMVEGTWEAEKAADGSVSYRLTPNDKTDTPATLVIAADKKTAVYTADGDAAINMSVPKPAVTVAYTFEGTTPTSYGRDASLTLELMSDGTATLTSSIFGSVGQMDAGTYTVVGGYKFTINFDKAGQILSNMVDRVVTIDYKQNGTQLGDLASTLTVKK